MIRPLRHWHDQVFRVLGYALPLVFAFGIAYRKPFPTMDKLPASMSLAAEPVMACDWQRSGLFGKSPVQVWFLRGETDRSLFKLRLSVANDFLIQPDLMVYWVSGNPTIKSSDPLPKQSLLLGGFDSGDLTLPKVAMGTNGLLVLYSLADNQIVDVSKPVLFRNRDP